MKFKDEIFETMGALHLAITNIENTKRRLEQEYKRADKIAKLLIMQENKYLARYGVLPDFYDI
jgi:hypothetical protein